MESLGVIRGVFLAKISSTFGLCLDNLTWLACLFINLYFSLVRKEDIRQQAQKETGINTEFYPGGDDEVLLKASTDPGSFDIYE